jgi:hypothetical protein
MHPELVVVFMERRMSQKSEEAGNAENHEDEVEHDGISRC